MVTYLKFLNSSPAQVWLEEEGQEAEIGLSRLLSAGRPRGPGMRWDQHVGLSSYHHVISRYVFKFSVASCNLMGVWGCSTAHCEAPTVLSISGINSLAPFWIDMEF